MPLSAMLQLMGVGLLGWLTWVRRTQRRRRIDPAPFNLRRVLEPVGHMREVLRADNAFFRYEAAFMTYGIGWMCCQALLPILATDKLHLSYAEYQNSTQVVFSTLMLIMIFPAGLLLDRIGAVRTCAIAFSLLTLYPLGLLIAGSASGVALASAAYGIAMAGVHQGWTLGPVAFAPTRDKAAHYAAIHATLVGIRGILFQALAMGLYKLTGGFLFPLLIAAAGFVWSAFQMIKLQQRMAGEKARRRSSAGVPAVQTATAGASTPGVR
jgi:MFS family permease